MKLSSFLSFSLVIFFISNVLTITPICQTDKDCPSSEYFCQKTSCDASHGKCFYSKDVICSTEIRPVCGCNGKLYNNVCAAAGAKQNLASMETCKTVTQIKPKSNDTKCHNDHQCGIGEFCSKSSCIEGSEGFCAKRNGRSFCTSDYKPVCGCNRKTYSNACVAFHSGMNIALSGECPSFATEELSKLGVCNTSADCSDNEYCNKPSCNAKQGVCSAKGDIICPQVYFPVCGCDGKTYSSVCHAMTIGVNVKANGECAINFAPAEEIETEERPKQKICKQSSDCHSTEFCSMETCTSTSGFCAPKGNKVCHSIYQPVCGCDKKTYSSSCHAYDAGVNLRDEGECPNEKDDEIARIIAEEAGRLKHMADRIKNKQAEIEAKINAVRPRNCIFNVDCEDHEYCRKDSCSDKIGLCTRHVGFKCSEVYNPVCGCNQRSYSTACHAMLGGINVAHKGACSAAPKNVTCEGPRHCLATEFCKKDSCGHATGTCWSKEHFFCANVYQPVCGCDGQTYNSSCHAHKKNVNVAYEGKCRSVNRVEVCNTNSDCGTGKWCHKSTCSGNGKCLEIVNSICAEVFEPVCGCNGVSYHNSCSAGNSLVSIQHKGECFKKF